MRAMLTGIVITTLCGVAQSEEIAPESLCDKPAIMQIILSADICARQSQISQAKEEIADEHKSARESGGGVVDKKAIYLRQQLIKDMSKHILTDTKRLRALRLKAMPCTNVKARSIAICINEPEHAGCEDANYKIWKELISNPKPYDPDNYDPVLWSTPRFSLQPPREPACDD